MTFGMIIGDILRRLHMYHLFLSRFVIKIFQIAYKVIYINVIIRYNNKFI
ncbi:MAG: hypothetical protein ACJAX4_000823 [Clostridium sp.]|jgi:hypothetical protein